MPRGMSISFYNCCRDKGRGYLRKEITMQLQDKGVLVTGAASGLGEACVRLLTQAGAKVVIADLNSDAGIALSTEHSHTGLSTLFVKTDVTNEESMRATVKEALETFGGLHILINCAGIGV